jgi:hypothetical protein
LVERKLPKLEVAGSTPVRRLASIAVGNPITSEAGIVRSVVQATATYDIYGAVLEYLNRIAPGNVYFYPYGKWERAERVSG